MQKPKKKPLVVKNPGILAVMANLMRQAQEEDYRREQMAELERSARSHLRISEERMAVKRTRFCGAPRPMGVTSSRWSAAMEAATAVWMRETCLRYRARRGRCGCRPSIRFAAPAAGDGEQPSTRSSENFTAPVVRRCSGFRWWPR